MAKAVRRDWIKRQIKAGKMEIKIEMILTDDYVWDAATDNHKTGWRKADINCFSDYDFECASGKAYRAEDGTIAWKICTNNYVKLRMVE